MTNKPTSTTEDRRTAEVRRVLWGILVLNVLVAAAKLILGTITGTVSMIADGFHSSMDASSNIIGLVGLQIAAQPPDEEHPYGHRRYETLATLAIGGLMLVAAWEILQTMLDRLLHGGTPEVTQASFVVMIGTMTVNLVVTLYERRKGNQLNSDILLADASHTSSDLLVSASVLLSLAITSWGYPWIDPVIALVIVFLIGRVGLQIIRQTSDTLADRQILDPQEIIRTLDGAPGVEEIVRVRSRGTADAVLIDVDTRIKPATTTEHAYAIARTIKERIQAALPQVAEVQVHFAPQRSAALDWTLEARAVADAMGLAVHEVIPAPTGTGVALEMHVEVPPGITLGDAHDQVTEFERRLKDRVPNLHEVVTHIEPANQHGAPLTHTQAALNVRDQAIAVAARLYPDAHWHHASIRLAHGGYAVTMHCALPASVSVEEAHAISEHVETSVRTELPLIKRVTIHTEPCSEEP